MRFLICLLIAGLAAAQTSNLPQPVETELKRLAETYRVLDFAAERVWPGWNDYRTVPFLLSFENGLRVLVGHPNPPAPFERVDTKVEDKAVFADRSNVNAKPLVPPLSAGGGPLPFGAAPDGRPVEVIQLQFRSAAGIPEAERKALRSEDVMLVNLHELFHCFQRAKVPRRPYGNPRFNPDLNYALYSEIEGLALLRAYQAGDAATAAEYLKDFLAARHRKRAGSLPGSLPNQESWEEFSEGTATYAELRTLEILNAGGFKPGLSRADDPEYGGFANLGELLGRYLERLKTTAANMTSNPKSYTYGCFQAVLLDRWFPGWQKSVASGVESLDAEIGRRIPITEAGRPALEQRLEERYPFAEIQKRHAAIIEARDRIYREFRERRGRVYVVDFKRTGMYLGAAIKKDAPCQLGLIRIYPEGIDAVRFDEVEVSAIRAPAAVDQLYYLRVVDTERRGSYQISGEKTPAGAVKNAVITTPLFTVKAPLARVREAGDLVKIEVLARVQP